MNDTANITASSDKKLGNLKAILFLLQSNLEEFKDEVDKSYSLLQIGEKTPLSQRIEKMLNDPIEGLFHMSGQIVDQIKQILDKLVKGFLHHNMDLIKAVYRSKTSMNDLHYSIVLKEDNMDNRDNLFEFLNWLDSSDISAKYPVYFQFVPVEFSDRINFVEEINLD